MSRILIVEDESVIRNAMRRLLERKGYRIDDVDSVERAESEYRLSDYDLIIADVRLPGLAGVELIKPAAPVPVLIMTSYASVQAAVDAMKRGAVDYIAKPFNHEELLLLVKRILKHSKQLRQQAVLKSELEKNYPVKGMVGECPAMVEICRRISKVAPTDTTTLILGESGTGKELVARALHEQSRRNDAPIITVNCAAIPEALIESELFGHEKGAFIGADTAHTGLIESADGGTLFLDEIEELPTAAQARLLRVLQNGEIKPVGSERSKQVDIRLIAATHQDLKQRVQEGEFRSDLYFRLRVMELNLPPLRERGRDIIKLSVFLLQKICKQLNRTTMELTQETLNAITSYPWPGNVRELENAIERAVILCENGLITPDLLAIDASTATEAAASPSEDLSLEDYFRQFVLQHQEGMTETELAKKLGISRKALWERRQRLGMPRPKR
ncbi:MAG: sigma-54-dependent Fis family transcriptional regulator [gamma proteobacterium endosymbiont of Lamellibrachia anaximandri]|nr:sigma-54-dependent Fis family transcriptional regulator [gamma proteobacterium endosymbiont of Lamellibrachia anaximandri]MBL3532893.1 sigma-54-dependent Fis family transcriptional regulator [gamma proteobacterium endosymbiont of Lamellibrachia anaximandri]